MKRDLLSVLCCPVCAGLLELHDSTETDREIISGRLVCQAG